MMLFLTFCCRCILLVFLGGTQNRSFHRCWSKIHFSLYSHTQDVHQLKKFFNRIGSIIVGCYRWISYLTIYLNEKQIHEFRFTEEQILFSIEYFIWFSKKQFLLKHYSFKNSKKEQNYRKYNPKVIFHRNKYIWIHCAQWNAYQMRI